MSIHHLRLMLLENGGCFQPQLEFLLQSPRISQVVLPLDVTPAWQVPWQSAEQLQLRRTWTLQRVRDWEEAQQLWSLQTFDLLLVNLKGLGEQGLEWLRAPTLERLPVPVVVLAAQEDVFLASHLLAQGVQDYLVMPGVSPEGLIRSLLHALERHHLMRQLQTLNQKLEERMAENSNSLLHVQDQLQHEHAALQQKEHLLKLKDLSLEASFHGVALCDLEKRLTYVNPAFLRMWGLPETAQVLGQKGCLFWENPQQIEELFESLSHQRAWQGRLRGRRGDGSLFPAQVSVMLIVDEARQPQGLTLSIVDLSHAELQERERQRLLALLEHTPDLVRIVDPEFRTLYLNPAGQRLLGLVGEAEFFGCPAQASWTLATAERMKQEILPVLEAHGHWRGELHLRRKDGQEFPVSAVLLCFWDAQGQIESYASIHRDLSELQQAHAQLAAREIRTQAILDTTVDAIITIDERGIVETYNTAAETLFGYSAAEVIGHNIKLLMPEAEASRHDDYLARYLQSGKAHIIGIGRRLRGQKKDGTIFPLHLGVSERWLGGQRFFTGVAHDLTHEAALEAQLLQSQKLEAIGKLAGGIAHDFNNILQGISMGLELLQLQLPPEAPAQKMLQQALSYTQRGAELVRQILTFSRRGEKDFVVFELSLVCQEVLKLLAPKLPGNVAVETQWSEALTIQGNPAQWHQVLMNLCTNALYAMRRQGGCLSLSLQQRELPLRETLELGLPAGVLWIVLTVSDTGEGIAPELQHRLFEPFFTTKPLGEGTGLGLAVVHGIVQNHRGKIRVLSQPGAGTRFELYLPPAEHPLPLPEATTPALQRASAARILLAEDEAMILLALEELLRGWGYQVTVAHDGKEALEAFQQDPQAYDLLLTDQSMPRLNGEGLVRAVLALRPDLPIVLMTGFSQEIGPENSSHLGVREFLYKPVRLEHLTQVLARLLPAGTLAESPPPAKG